MALQGTSPFSITVLDANDNILGDGPITTAISCDTTEKLDEIGGVTFTLPANDPRAVEIRSGRKFDIYDEQDGYLGRFTFADKDLRENQGSATLKVTAYDSLAELKRDTAGFKRKYTYHDVGQVVQELAGLMDFIVEADSDIGFTTLTLEGESPLRGIDELRDRFKQHFRLKRGTFDVLQFGVFGADSGIRITNMPGQIQPVIGGKPEIAISGALNINEDAEEIYNRVVCVGAGQGEALVTMEGATSGVYTLESATNQDGSLYYYVQDSDSIDAYGLRTKVLSINAIRFTDNTELAKTRAADTLKLTAEAYLLKHKDPRVTYDASAYKVDESLQVGDTIQLVYREERDNIVYLDVDVNVFVMEMYKFRAATGKRSVDFLLAETDQKRTTDKDAMIEVVRDLKIVKQHTQPTASIWQIVGSDYCATNDSALLSFTIGSELTNITRITLNIRARRVRSFISQVPIATSDRVFFNVNTALGNVYPDYLRMLIDGSGLHGLGQDFRWDAAQAQATLYGINETFDITDLIRNSSFGLYATHSIGVFGSRSHPAITEITGVSAAAGGVEGDGNLGIIDFIIRVECTVQAILSE